MQIVEIPILNLKLKISKIAFNIFGIDINDESIDVTIYLLVCTNNSSFYC